MSALALLSAGIRGEASGKVARGKGVTNFCQPHYGEGVSKSEEGAPRIRYTKTNLHGQRSQQSQALTPREGNLKANWF